MLVRLLVDELEPFGGGMEEIKFVSSYFIRLFFFICSSHLDFFMLLVGSVTSLRSISDFIV